MENKSKNIFFNLVTLLLLVVSTDLLAGEKIQLKKDLNCNQLLVEFESAKASQLQIKPFMSDSLGELYSKNLKLNKAHGILSQLNKSSTQATNIQAVIDGENAKYLEVITSDCKDLREDKKKCANKLEEILATDYQDHNDELIDDMGNVLKKIEDIKKSKDYRKLDKIAKYYAQQFVRKNCQLDDEYKLSEIKEYGCNQSIPNISDETTALAGEVAKVVTEMSQGSRVTETEVIETCKKLDSGKLPSGCKVEGGPKVSAVIEVSCPDGYDQIGGNCLVKCPEFFFRDQENQCVADVEAQQAEHRRVIENRETWWKVAKIGGIVLAAGGAIGLAAWGISAIVDAENNAGGGTYTPTSYYNPYMGGYNSYYPSYGMPYYNPYMYSYPGWVGYQHTSSNTPYTFEF